MRENTDSLPSHGARPGFPGNKEVLRWEVVGWRDRACMFSAVPCTRELVSCHFSAQGDRSLIRCYLSQTMPWGGAAATGTAPFLLLILVPPTPPTERCSSPKPRFILRPILDFIETSRPTMQWGRRYWCHAPCGQRGRCCRRILCSFP